MIGTAAIKSALYNGYFSIGNPNAEQKVLILGSCRSVPYLNYFDDLINRGLGDFYVTFIDPYDFHWDNRGRIRDSLSDGLAWAEYDTALRNVLQRTSIFIHEYYKSFGMFNTVGGGGIYSRGLSPRIDIGIPNFHDKLILAHDVVTYDPVARVMLCDNPEIGELYVKQVGRVNLERFRLDVIRSGVPRFLQYFDSEIKRRRLFSNINHVVTAFTFGVWLEILKKLGIDATAEHLDSIGGLSMYEECAVKLCQWDVDNFGFQWGESLIGNPVVCQVSSAERSKLGDGQGGL